MVNPENLPKSEPTLRESLQADRYPLTLPDLQSDTTDNDEGDQGSKADNMSEILRTDEFPLKLPKKL